MKKRDLLLLFISIVAIFTFIQAAIDIGKLEARVTKLEEQVRGFK